MASTPLKSISAWPNWVRRDVTRRASARDISISLPPSSFSGIDAIGHGFADELFRVFRREYPGVELLAKKMAPAVGAMVASVTA